MLKAGLVGFGGIATAHRTGYYNLEKCGKVQLVCACDINPDAFHTKVAINLDATKQDIEENIRFYTDLDEMLRQEDIDFLDLCIPTFLHKEVSIKLLRSGYHVLCEKPMALSYQDCTEMISAAKESGKELMIGQCLRFFPAYEYAKEAIDSGRFGSVLGAYFSRLSVPPIWGWENWFMDPQRSGGCLTDLHIHDVDFVRYAFGEPKAVSCQATTSLCVHDTVHSSFFYNGVPVTAIGDWSLVGVPFEASYRIDFEKASMLCTNGTITIYPKDGSESYSPQLDTVDGYQGEIAYFCDVIEGKTANTKNPATSAAQTINLIEHLRTSAAADGKTIPFASEK